MKTLIHTGIIAGLALATATSAQAAFTPGTEVYSEDFTSTTTYADGDAVIGGSTETPSHRETTYLTWNHSPAPVTNVVSGGVFKSDAAENSRGGGVFISAADMNVAGGGAGLYEVSFDVLSYTAGNALQNPFATAQVWSFSDINLDPAVSTDSARVIMDTQQPTGVNLEIHTGGSSATVTALNEVNPTVVGTDQTMTFTYDGTSDIALLFGSAGGRDVEWDNISITAVVPEPGTYALFAGFLALAGVAIRSRRS